MSSHGTWTTVKVDGEDRVDLNYGALVGVEVRPGSAYSGGGVGDELVPADQPIVLAHYIGDPDANETYKFSSCPTTASS